MQSSSAPRILLAMISSKAVMWFLSNAHIAAMARQDH
jgi:hypothetical protein